MPTKTIAEGTVHKLPTDLRKALLADESALERWEDITALARNEWICWAVSVKKESTRMDHVRRVVDELLQGMRRPCCWIGCIHRSKQKDSSLVK